MSRLSHLVILLFCAAILLFPSVAAAQWELLGLQPRVRVDNSSYEALLKQVIELEKASEVFGLPSSRTIDALVKHHMFDVAVEALSPQRDGVMQAVFVRQVAGGMIEAGQVEEGLDVYRRLMPSGSLDGDLGSIDHLGTVFVYSQQYDAALRFVDSIPHQNTRSGFLYAAVSNIVGRRSVQRNLTAMETEMAHKQAALFMERLLQERGGGELVAYHISEALAFMGRSDEAYQIAKNEGKRDRLLKILCMIADERDAGGHHEEAEKWYQKAREEFYNDDGTPNLDHGYSLGYICLCITLGKYEEALDLSQQINSRNGGTLGFNLERVARANVETSFRHHSETLTKRMIEISDQIHTGLNRSATLTGIAHAQVRLGLFDDAMSTLARMGVFHAPNAFSVILADLIASELPEKATEFESGMLALMESSEDSFRYMKIVEAYAMCSALLFDRGMTEEGTRYWNKTIDRIISTSEDLEQRHARIWHLEQVWHLEQAAAPMIRSGHLEPVLEVLHRFDARYPLPTAWLMTAEKQVEINQLDAANESLKRGVAALPRIDPKAPIHLKLYAQAATIAAALGDKESFDTIVSSGMALMIDNGWHRQSFPLTKELLIAFSRSAAKLEIEDHPIYETAETMVAGFSSAFDRSELLCSLAVSWAMLGMHEESLRLLKRAAEENVPRFGQLAESIIEAKSYYNP